MVNRKAQSQIITTVLIILLVLAAIIIVWQVINVTVQQGSSEIEGQSSCLGLRMDITNIQLSATNANVTIRPSKAISGYQLYINGVAKGPANSENTTLDALSTKKVPIGTGVILGDDIEVISIINGAVCPGTKSTAK